MPLPIVDCRVFPPIFCYLFFCHFFLCFFFKDEAIGRIGFVENALDFDDDGCCCLGTRLTRMGRLPNQV
jgi:hypothetical protein